MLLFFKSLNCPSLVIFMRKYFIVDQVVLKSIINSTDFNVFAAVMYCINTILGVATTLH